jgi:hypothetical protein
MTAANALHFIYTASGDDGTRKLALLQAASWIPLYRERIGGGARIRIDAFEPAENQGNIQVQQIVDALAGDRSAAAAQLLAYARGGGALSPLFAAARQLVFTKGRDSHQYKYGGAVWEETVLATDDRWRAPLAAASLFYLPAPSASDTPWLGAYREQLARV